MTIENLESKQDLFNWLKENITTILPPGNVQAQIAYAVAGIVLPPPGSVFFFAAATAPDGYLACDGSAVSRTVYANLFAACGTTYGVGDGSTTFNLPDLRGRAAYGLGTSTDLGALANHDPYLAVDRTPFHLHRHSHTHPMPHTHGFTTGDESATTAVADAPHQHAESGGGTTGNQNANETVADNNHHHSGTTGGVSTADTDPPSTTNTATETTPFLVLLAVVKT